MMMDISIHALLAESDSQHPAGMTRTTYFYPRSPCGERPTANTGATKSDQISIHALLAESDRYSLRHSASGRHFYPRSPCGERLWPGLLARPFFIISIHALLAESDLDRWLAGLKGTLFLSTLSLRRATHNTKNNYTDYCDFYPRSPCGERLGLTYDGLIASAFLSTLSLRRATSSMTHTQKCCVYFYPRSPCGERRYLINTYHRIFGISIHALLAESDGTLSIPITGFLGFLSTLSLRRATA